MYEGVIIPKYLFTTLPRTKIFMSEVPLTGLGCKRYHASRAVHGFATMSFPYLFFLALVRQGFGFRVSGFGFRAQGLGFRV